MNAADALDICLGLFHLWLCAALLVLLGLAAWDTWRCLTHPFQEDDN